MEIESAIPNHLTYHVIANVVLALEKFLVEGDHAASAVIQVLPSGLAAGSEIVVGLNS